MKKRIWIVLIVVFLVNGVAWAQIGTSTVRNLLVRSGPGKNHRVIAKIRRGDQPLVERIQGNWVKLAWKEEAWVAKNMLLLKQGTTRSSATDGPFLRWLIHDTKVNWTFIDRKRGNSISLWVRMNQDRYGDLAEVRYIANNLAESYRFHTGHGGLLEIRILKPDAKFVHDIYFQAIFT